MLELRREQPNQDPEQHGPHVGRLVGRLQRDDPLGDDTPLGCGNAGRCLEQVHRLRAEPRPLDLEEVIEPVKGGGETVGEHTGEVAFSAAILTASKGQPFIRRLTARRTPPSLLAVGESGQRFSNGTE